MARSFDGINDRITVARNILLESPTNKLTIAIWHYRDGNQDQYDRLAEKEYQNAINPPFVSYAIEYGISNTFTFNIGIAPNQLWTAGGNTALTNVTWNHLLGTYDGSLGSANLKAYLNGTQESTTQNITGNILYDTTSTGQLDIGGRGADGNWLKGYLAELAIWSTVLNTSQIAALNKGFSPLFYLKNLIFYMPLIGRNSPETDIINGLTGTVTEAIVTPHPRIIYPSSAQIRRFSTAAPPSPAALNAYRRLLGVGL